MSFCYFYRPTIAKFQITGTPKHLILDQIISLEEHFISRHPQHEKLTMLSRDAPS